MVENDKRDAIVNAWNQAGAPWSQLAGLTFDVPWGFGVTLEALGLLDEVGNYRPVKGRQVIVGIRDTSLVIVEWSESDRTHNAEFSIVSLDRVEVNIVHQSAKQDIDAGSWTGSVTFNLDGETFEIELRRDEDLKWATEVFEAKTRA